MTITVYINSEDLLKFFELCKFLQDCDEKNIDNFKKFTDFNIRYSLLFDENKIAVNMTVDEYLKFMMYVIN